MPEKSSPTPAELAVLQVLWQLGPATVRQIYNTVKGERDTGYSTTLKIIQIMTEKGLLRKDDSVRPQIYRPAQPQSRTQLQLIDELIQRAFGGSASKLVMQAVAAKRMTPSELAEIKSVIEKAKKRE
jgi:predicted transcriptional regulator